MPQPDGQRAFIMSLSSGLIFVVFSRTGEFDRIDNVPPTVFRNVAREVEFCEKSTNPLISRGKPSFFGRFIPDEIEICKRFLLHIPKTFKSYCRPRRKYRSDGWKENESRSVS